MAEFKIEKEVPCPKRGKGGGKWQQLAAMMKKNDSVVLPTGTQKSGLFSAIRRAGGQACSRRVENGYRVWRIK